MESPTRAEEADKATKTEEAGVVDDDVNADENDDDADNVDDDVNTDENDDDVDNVDDDVKTVRKTVSLGGGEIEADQGKIKLFRVYVSNNQI